MNLTNYYELTILDYLFGAGANDLAPGTLYLAASTTDPGEPGTGKTEPNAIDGYARIAITNDGNNWGPATLVSNVVSKANLVSFSFPAATAPWGTITHWCLLDAPTGGNALLYGPLSTPQDIGVDEVLRIPLGGMVITLD